MGAESYTIFPELALIVHGKRLARFVIDEIEHRRDRAVRSDRLAHDLAALCQVFVRDRLRRGQVRASRRDSVLIRRLSLNRLAVRQKDNCNEPYSREPLIKSV